MNERSEAADRHRGLALKARGQHGLVTRAQALEPTPDGERISTLTPPKFQRLIKVRENFDRELMQSVNAL